MPEPVGETVAVGEASAGEPDADAVALGEAVGADDGVPEAAGSEADGEVDGDCDGVAAPEPETDGVALAGAPLLGEGVDVGVADGDTEPLGVGVGVALELGDSLELGVAEPVIVGDAVCGQAIPRSTSFVGGLETRPSVTNRYPAAFIAMPAGQLSAASAPTPSGGGLKTLHAPRPAMVMTSPLGRIARMRWLPKSATKIALPPTGPGAVTP